MRFIHIADVHLGAKPDSEYKWGKYREKEIRESFLSILSICEKEQIDLLLIAGDLYHRQPLLRELKELNYRFEQLTHTAVVVIAGNHDFIGPKSNYIGFQWAENVHMLNQSELNKVYLPELNCEVYGFSYHKRNIIEPRYETAAPDDNEHIHILLAHGGDEKNIPIDKKKISELPFDYIALGHIHKPEIISNKAAYAGSFEPLDKAELGTRGYIKGELTKENVSIEFISHSSRRYEWLNVHVNPDMAFGALKDEISDRIADEGSNNIYRIHLVGYKDTDITFDEEEIKELGNVIEILDDSVPDYNFEELRNENKDNIIGLYIDRIHESNTEDDVKIKALYYGLEALLNAKKHL